MDITDDDGTNKHKDCKQSSSNSATRPNQIKEILVLHTGGTIGMKKNEHGILVPVANTFTNTLKSIRELYDKDMADQLNLKENQLVMTSPNHTTIIYKIKEYDPLLGSSNISKNEWIQIAEDIKNEYANFDGFVVLHGTDTLTFTSSILSFMLENLSKPVIITGSQIPIFEACTDAVQNIFFSLIFASSYDLPEVAVFFHNKLFRGNRLKKIDAVGFAAFDSPNYHPLAEVDLSQKIRDKQITLYANYALKPPHKCNKFVVHTNLNTNIGIIYFFPSITAAQIDAFLQPPLAGAVIQTFGNGNIPSNNKDIIYALKKAIDKGVVIINVTQCNKGSVTCVCESAQVSNEIGIISGNDMTVEAAYAKLVVVLSMPQSADRTNFLKHNMRGEMTE